MRRLRSSSIKSRGVVFLVLLVCLFSVPAQAQPWDGNGVEGDPYLIYDACDMQAIGADPNFWDTHFKLMVDIDLGGFTGAEYNIIGNWDTPFRGVFDGNGHRIYNFTYDSNVVNYIGLFLYVDDPNSEIKNLGLIDPNIDGPGGTVSSLVVRLENGTVTDCYVEGGRISGLGDAGGLVGSLGLGGPGGPTATVSNCHASVNVSGYGSVGGLVGSNAEATISNCYSTGSVTGNGYRAGGLVGENRLGGEISDCYSTCAVSGDWYVGGLVGDNDNSAHISNSSATGNVTGTGHFIGGLVGANHSDGTISGCYAAGDVNGRDGGRVGGLVGVNTSDILNSYANGSVSGGLDVGGLVGENWNGTISNCYSAGSVSGSSDVGGLVGHDDSASYTRCFWDNTVNPSLTGIGNGSNPEVIGESTTNMQMAVTFAGWGCEPVWTIDEGNDYPRLWWENAPGEVISNQWYAGGSGEPNDPYLIETAEQLNVIGLVQCDWDNHFQLTVDIDLASYTGTSFNIIGSYVGTDDPSNKPFTGVFDGDGHTISNFTYSSDGNDLIAIFAYVDDVNAEIKNLGLIDPNIDAGTGWGIGALVGWLKYGTVRNCYVEGGSVSGGGSVGGLVGASRGDIFRCYSTASVMCGSYNCGGLAGLTVKGKITSCYSSGDVSGNWRVGGLVGWNNDGVWSGGPATISSCYATGSVSGDSRVGGLVGHNSGFRPIVNCYSTGSVSGTGSEVGGLVGFGGGIDSFWDVNSSGQASSSGGTPKTTAEMQTESTFTDAGWDFVGEVINGPNDIWTICEGEDYPRLAWEKYGGGNGTEANPYLIRTSCQMNAIGADSNDWDKHFKLMADIDLSGYTGTSFNIIGIYIKYNDPNNRPFTGVFDGNDHVVSNFSYSSTAENRVGLFGWIDDPNAEVKNLGLINPYVNSEWGNSVGALVGGLRQGRISGCFVEGGSVSGGYDVGGLVGDNMYGSISDSYSTGEVAGEERAGGLVGYNYSGDISSCYSTCSVIGVDEVGGLVGSNGYGSSISNSYSEGIVTAGIGRIGGLVGYNEGGNITSCYSTCSVTGIYHVGGLVGSNYEGDISSCYSTDEVAGEERVGGLVGSNYSGDISSCYSTCSVTGIDRVGGLVGYANSDYVIDSFWDVNSSGIDTSDGGTGLPTVEMQTESTFTDAGWDFVGEVINGPNDIWDICEGTNYPKFVWQIPAADFVCPDGVTFIDFSILGLAWYSDPNQPNWNLICDISEPNDNFIDELDLKVFSENWLAGM